MNTRELIDQISTVYYHNKNRKIGQTCKCPICHKEFVKKTNKQVFVDQDMMKNVRMLIIIL